MHKGPPRKLVVSLSNQKWASPILCLSIAGIETDLMLYKTELKLEMQFPCQVHSYLAARKALYSDIAL